MSEIVLKALHDGKTLRLRVDADKLTLSTLKNLLISEFSPSTSTPNTKNMQDMHVKYFDDTDTIDILSDNHLKEAIKLTTELNLSCLRLLFTNAQSSNSNNTQSSNSNNILNYTNWNIRGNKSGNHPLANSLLKEISETHQQVAQRVIDWWLTKMPEAYFREINHDTRQTHLRALIALQMTGQKSEISLFDKTKSIYTVIKPNNYVGLLSEVIQSLPDKPLREANIYTSIDDDLVIDVFEFEDETTKPPKFSPAMYGDRYDEITKMYTLTNHAANHDSSNDSTTTMLEEYLKSCELYYILNASTHEIIRHFELVQESRLKENVEILLESHNDQDSNINLGVFSMDSLVVQEDTNQCRLMVVLPSTLQQDSFARIVRHLGRLQVDILKATLVRVYGYKGSEYLIFTFHVRSVSSTIPLVPNSALSSQLMQDIKRLPFLDDSVLEWADENPSFSIQESEIVVAICKLVHCLLSEERPLVFTQYHIMAFVREHQHIMRDIVKLCELKFAPREKSFSLRRNAVNEASNKIRLQIEKHIELEDCRMFFTAAMSVVLNALKVNFGLGSRFSFVFRLNGDFFHERSSLNDHNSQLHTTAATQLALTAKSKENDEIPYGIIYAFGRGFQGFHLRFRDIARGGLRVLEPGSMEQYTVANRTFLSECYNLASAQHLKNKDIPEGGAKAMILIEPGKTCAENAVKAFTDGLLDLTCTASGLSTSSDLAEYTKEQELIFLGPDDNITNEMIVWICKRANMRKYPFPDCFMSSKPGAGINHRQFGVISVGVVVFLDVAIRSIGIDPQKQSFTIKMTGGPDGEISGNLIILLSKCFGANARIVAIADRSGVAEDPAGLDCPELKRLVSANLPIIEYSKFKLSNRGHVISINEGGGAGMKARNTMPFRVESDVFLPAGGNTYSINDVNWKSFLTESKTPTSKLIIESSNLYISPIAKQNLSHHGVLIVPDSTATKGGVICSSYEILAGMLLNENEFLEMKEQYVSEVLDRLRHFAQLEGEMLFREFQKRSSRLYLKSCSLPDISSRISKAIIQFKDALYNSGMIEVYGMPQMDMSQDNSNKIFESITASEQRAFFIESPPSSPFPSPIEKADPFYIFKHQAREAGFVYNHGYHRLCRQILLDYTPPSLRAFLHFHKSGQKLNMDHKKSEEENSLFAEWQMDKVVPIVYRKRIIATAIACKIVYREGYEILDDLLDDKDDHDVKLDKRKTVTEWALKYLIELERTKQVIHSVLHVKDLDLEVKKHIIRLLEKGGTRISIELSEIATAE